MPLSQDKIQVIGMSIRARGIQNLHDFSENLRNGTSTLFDNEKISIEELSSQQLKINLVSGIDDYEYFCPELFGISEEEAPLVDPQIREMLKVSIKAIEDAGIDILNKSVGVVASMGESIYLQDYILRTKNNNRSFEDFKIAFNTEKDYASLRISNALNLKGPSLTVQSTCSSGLVGVATGMDMLQMRRCDYVLVVSGFIDPNNKQGYIKTDGDMLSTKGRLSPFDSSADGTVFADLACAVILTRDSKSSPDIPYANIVGSSVNNDGRKAVFTAPSEERIRENLKNLYNNAIDDDFRDLYVEMHGSGTLLGDSIEWKATVGELSKNERVQNSITIGSVKSMLGHGSISSGLAGLIKCCLSIEQQIVFGMKQFSSLSRFCRSGRDVVYIPTENGSLERKTSFIVSSLGMGGTNCHVLLREPIVRTEVRQNNSTYCLMVTELSIEHLHSFLAKLLPFIKENLDKLDAICYEFAIHRFHHKERVYFIANDKESILDQINTTLEKGESRSTCKNLQGDLEYGSYGINELNDWVNDKSDKLLVIPKRLHSDRLKGIPYPDHNVRRYWIDKPSDNDFSCKLNQSSAKSSDEVLSILGSICASSIGNDTIDESLSFTENGGDSLSAISFSTSCEELGVKAPKVFEILADKPLNALFEGMLKDYSSPKNKPQRKEDIIDIPSQHFGMLIDSFEDGSDRFFERYIFKIDESEQLTSELLLTLRSHLADKFPVLNSTISFDENMKPVLQLNENISKNADSNQFNQLFEINFVDAKTVLFSIHHLICDFSSAILIAKEIKKFFASTNSRNEENRRTEFNHPNSKQKSQFQFPRLSEGIESEISYQFWDEMYRSRKIDFQKYLNFSPSNEPPKFYSFRIEGELFEKVEEYLKHEQGISKPGFFLSIISVALKNIMNEKELIFGTPFNFRDQSNQNDLGSYINTLPILAPLFTNSLKEYAMRCTSILYKSFSYSDVDLSQLLTELSLPVSRAEVFYGYMFTFQNLTEQSKDDFDWESFVGLPPKISRTGILFRVEYNVDNYSIEIECDPKFSHDFVPERIISCFGLLLKEFLENPLLDANSCLEIVKRSEIGQFYPPYLVSRSGTTNFHSRLIDTLSQFGDSVILDIYGRKHTFQDIHLQMCQFSGALKELGISYEAPVLLVGDLDQNYLSCFLAMMHRGAVPILLDKDEFSLFDYVIQNVNPALIISSGENTYQNNEGIPFRSFEEILSFECSYEHHLEQPHIARRNAAYISFTSGSTGERKPVCVTYRGLMTMIEEQIKMFNLNKGSRVLKTFSLSSDASISEILTAVFSGSTLVTGNNKMTFDEMPDDDTARTIEHLTLLPESIPSILNANFNSLKTIISAGDAAKDDEFSLIPEQVRLVNAYGPAEATVCTHMSILTKRGEPNCIGRPLKKVNARIVNTINPCANSGILVINGDQVARGYVNNPQLTLSNFRTSFRQSDFDSIDYFTNDLVHKIDDFYYFDGRVSNYLLVLGQKHNVGALKSKVKKVYPTLGLHFFNNDLSRMSPCLEITNIQSLQNESEEDIVIKIRRILRNVSPLLESLVHFKFSRKVEASFNGQDSFELDPMDTYEQTITNLWKKILPSSSGQMDEDFFDSGGDSLRLFQLTTQLKQHGFNITLREAARAGTLGSLIDALTQSTDD